MERVEFSKLPISSKLVLERMIGNAIRSEVGAVMCVILSRAEKHLSYGELVGTTECITP